MCLTAKYSLDYVMPINKSTWMSKRTFEAREGTKRSILECTSIFLTTPLKYDRSKRFKLRLT